MWETHLLITLGPLDINESLRHVVNDALTTFFFIVGLEIKRESAMSVAVSVEGDEMSLPLEIG